VRRRLTLTAAGLPIVAALIVGVAGFVTPGYDPLTRTVSRLAAPGMPFAVQVDLAIAAMGLACVALGLAAGRGRVVLVVAGAGFVVASVIHLDPASAPSMGGHHIASGVAVGALTAAPLVTARAYGRLSLLLGLAEVALLAVAAVLLTMPFPAWGAWERCLLAVQVCWLLAIALRIASTEDTMSAPAAMVRSAGS
jgi:hypothetical protein